MSAVHPKLEQLVSEFRRLISTRIQEFAIDAESLGPLPDSAAIVRSYSCKAWLPVPGMHGGFSYQLIDDSPLEPKLRVSSWSRVVGGSEQRHEVTPDGSVLLDDDA